MLLGYARASLEKQTIERQLDELTAAGVKPENIFNEKITGTRRDREELNKMLEALQPDDTVIAVELSRMGRSTKDLERIAVQEQQTVDLSRFLTKIRKYTRVMELMPTMLNELVERIEIHAPDKAEGKRNQDIDIYFNHIGLIGKLEFAKAKSSQPKAQPKAISGENGGAGSPKGIYLLYENA